MENNPIISIILPVYNVESYLDNCITSIINQTFTSLEIILVNDGSTDNSGYICDHYANNDQRIIVIHKNNQGVSEARNAGIKIAQGKYIAFIDGDDYIHPQMLEILYYFLTINEDISFSIAKEIKVYDVPLKNDTINLNNITTYILQKDDLINCLYKSNNNIYTSFLANIVNCKLYKSSIIKDLLFRNFKISEDTEYNSRLYQTCSKAIYIDYPMYYYVQRDTSLSHQSLKSINHINRINMYYTCLCNTPTNSIYRGLILEKLYKFMINIRYHNRYNKQGLDVIAKIIPKIQKKTFAEF